MKQILLDFWAFIKDPKDEQYKGEDKIYKWKVFFNLFILELLLLIIYIPITIFLDEFIESEEAFDESYNALTTLGLFVLLVPFIEELIFRYFLKRTGFLTYVFKEKTWHRIYPILFYASVLTFGFVHITNYEITSVWILIAAPILVFTQIIGGFVMSYLRVKFNFWMGFLYHALWNFTAIFIIEGSYYLLNIDKVEIKNDTYELVVEPVQFLSLSESKRIEYTAGKDSVFIVKAKYQTTEELLEGLSLNNFEFKGNSKLIHLYFKSEKGIHKDSLLSILEKEGYIEKKAKTN